MNFSILKKFLALAHFRARALRIFYHLCQKTMIFEFSQRCEIRRAPRAEMRARQNFFWNRKVHEIYYLLCVWNIFISIELIIVNGYEMCVFFYNFSKKIWFFLENFQNLQIFKKIEFSRKNFKLQIALKNLLFELWPNKKICNEILS